VWITGGLTLSGLALTQLFKTHVTEQFDSELHGHSAELETLLRLDASGAPYLSQRLSDPRFLPTHSGYYWKILAPKGRSVKSPSLKGGDLPLDLSLPPDGKERTLFVRGPKGTVRMVQTSVQVDGSPGPIWIGIGTDQSILDGVLLHFNATLYASLAIIACGLIAAAMAQITFGLSPLKRLEAELRAIRTGERDQVGNDLPQELQPLVSDLNALIVINRDMLLRARAQAGNLAHALKTPMAIIADEARLLEESGHVKAAHTLAQQTEKMQRQIDFQLARSRAAASSLVPWASTLVSSVLPPIITAMERLHLARGLRFSVAPYPALSVACDPQDLSEILANLLDNAAKWANTEVRVSVRSISSSRVQVVIEDDGAGLPPEAWDVVFDMGKRLDEQAPGSGLGLAIVRDLVSLYGGKIYLKEAELGGLAAVLELPLVNRSH